MTLTSKTLKEHERVHLLMTLRAYGPLPGTDLVRIANSECQLDVFDQLPEISARGVAQKLNAMSLGGLVERFQNFGGTTSWKITDAGKEYAYSFEAEHGDDS